MKLDLELSENYTLPDHLYVINVEINYILLCHNIILL